MQKGNETGWFYLKKVKIKRWIGDSEWWQHMRHQDGESERHLSGIWRQRQSSVFDGSRTKKFFFNYKTIKMSLGDFPAESNSKIQFE